MNSSEIAERAARELAEEIASSITPVEVMWGDELMVIRMAEIGKKFVERAIEESRGQRWIPVEEKLPDRNIDVIVALDADGDSPRESAVDHMTSAGWYNHLEKYVTHWQPLPDPPKEPIAKWCCDGKQATGEDLHNPNCRYHHSNYEPRNSPPMNPPKGNENV